MQILRVFTSFPGSVVLFAILLSLPQLSESRIGTGIVDLTQQTFDSFVRSNPKVMVDIVKEAGDETTELLSSLRMIRQFGSNVPIARVDASHNPELAQRFVGCSEQTGTCGGLLPQLIWFLHGEPTQYHRSLRKPQNIASFVLAVDREPLKMIQDENYVKDWNTVVVARVERLSSLYKALEVVALRHMDGVAFAHIETPGGHNISWITDQSLVDTFSGTEDVEPIDDWVRGKLTQSEELPDQPKHDGSIVVVGKTFESLVLRPDQDVMLIVYAPWCGFCRKVMPLWSRFAHLMAGVPNAPLVAKMDGTRNRSPLPDLHWTAYPTIIYIRAATRTPIIFDATRQVEAFVEFAEKHSTKPFKLNLQEDSMVLMQKEIEL